MHSSGLLIADHTLSQIDGLLRMLVYLPKDSPAHKAVLTKLFKLQGIEEPTDDDSTWV